VKDPQRAINLIGQTALLEFKLVDDEGNIDEALRGRVPRGTSFFINDRLTQKQKEPEKPPFS